MIIVIIRTIPENQMNKQSKVSAVVGDIVKFNRAKVTIAAPASQKMERLAELGTILGEASVENELYWIEALKIVDGDNDRRIVLRDHFVPARMTARAAIGKTGTKDAAILFFNRLAKLHAPGSSRKAKSNETKAKRAKGGGRKAKQGATKTTMSEKTLQRNVVAALAYIAKAQARHMGDDETLETLGSIAALLSKK